MSMTREEAAHILEYSRIVSENFTQEAVTATYVMALAALRGPTREQVEKVWRGEWMGSADGYADGELVYDTWECSHCGYVIDEEDDPDMLPQFCPKCYAAMTDEAVEMVMERINKMEETGDGLG